MDISDISPVTYRDWPRIRQCANPPHLFVSESGRVYRSVDDTLVFKRTRPNAFGYHLVRVNKGRGRSYEYFALHKLVLEAFVGPCPGRHLGLHKDDDRSNNRLGNLYWGTHCQNSADMIANGLFDPPCGRRRFSDEVVASIRAEYPGLSMMKIAAKHGCSISYVSRVISGELR